MTTRPSAFWLAAGSAFVFLLVWEQLQSVRLGYRLEQLHAQALAQQDKNAYLRLELERLRSPQWLAQAAKLRLKMGPPSPEAVTVLGVSSPRTGPRAAPSWFLSRMFADSRDFR